MQAPKKHTNRLINETSPYLLQHAHNPVDWYAWDDEAFVKAKAEDKPVLVSIGYSACHWCHVMEHESFEDEATARIMNDNFVNIKVDMEERPDVDQIYMTFVQLTTGRGGWPMTVFMTPDKLPFFGGTYFPPAPRYGMPSFQQILTSIAEAYRDRRDEILRSANDILGELRRITIPDTSATGFSTDLLDGAFENFSRSFDAKNGGFGGAPKFPPSMSLEFLLRYWKRTGNERALEMVERTARKMAEGGIYDQLGGGFHRYSVDAVWLVPHFEKMLYDNAQLIRIYLHLFQITKDEFFKGVAVQTLDYVKREMLDASGGFYSTQDADSEGEEGKFFVWTPAEVEAILGEKDAQVFNFFYDVSEDGNFEGKNILNIQFTVDAAAEALKMDTADVESTLSHGRKKLFEEREKRTKPNRDEKILTAWNGLMLAAFAEAAAVLRNEEYLAVAKQNADFLLDQLRHDGSLLRTWKSGKAKLNAYIEDYANLADGLMELFQVSGEARYLDEARSLISSMITEFWDKENGGFYFTSHAHESLIVRNKDFTDNATPSGNSVAAEVLLKLSKINGDESFDRYATKILSIVAGQARRYPQGFGRALSAMEFALQPTKEIIVIADKSGDLTFEIWSRYIPNKIVVKNESELSQDSKIPLLEGRDAIDGKPTAYVCENFVCKRPATSADELAMELDQ
ncbi:MAG TPA: thioredoxin domain-containing protein [Pyrinomonadaceae bacterium]|nr:thioredoxin domain-containing protein [Pyrinomonadaceae bacterium]